MHRTIVKISLNNQHTEVKVCLARASVPVGFNNIKLPPNSNKMTSRGQHGSILQVTHVVVVVAVVVVVGDVLVVGVVLVVAVVVVVALHKPVKR